MKRGGGKAARDLADAVRRAMMFHQRGELQEARRRYRAILSAFPDHFDVLHALGVLELQEEHAEEACRLLARAVNIQSGSPEAHLNLGNALRMANRNEAALASYERALALRPDYAEAHNNIGNTYQDLARREESLASYERALTLVPDFVDAHFNRGVILHALDRHEDALASYERALALDPSHVEALANRGNVLHDMGRHEDALASYDRALAVAPSIAEVHNNRGNALRDLRRHDEAYASYSRALELKPDYAEAHFNLGVFFHEFRCYKDEAASYDRALALDPDHAGALYMRGLALHRMNRFDDAVRDFNRVLELNPPDPDFSDTLGNRLYARIRACDWTDFDSDVQRVVAAVRAGRRAMPPFAFLAISDSAQDQLLCTRAWARDKFPPAAPLTRAGERYQHDRIRVAYLSADMREHPASFLLAGMFERHDRSRFEIIAISFGEDDHSEIGARLRGAFDQFIDVRTRSDAEIATLVRELEIDIAVDLMGHTQYSRMGIFAHRPAPVQVNFFCPGTSGVEYMDYIISDRVVIPEEHQPCYTEQVVYLPDTFQANDDQRRIAEHTPTRAEAGLPERGFVFCSFNNTYKFNPAIFGVWMRLLRRVEGSVLWLQEISASAAHNLRREAVARGIDEARLIFAPRVPRLEDHLARYRLADLFLDTLPYTAQSTASDALWAGLPVLTCMGSSFVGRVAASLLNAAGVSELITGNLQDYEVMALKLAMDSGLLSAVRERLAENRERCPLFDTARFCRHIESAYAEMYGRVLEGAQPAGFMVNPSDSGATRSW